MRLARLTALVFLCILAGPALTQGFPEKPVRFLVPLTPGGSPDTMARAVATRVAELWKQPVVVENRPGANQNLAPEMVARSAPDGYTWLLVPNNVFVMGPHMGKVPFDVFADFTPVTQLASLQFLLAVTNSLEARSVKELVALARARPGALDYGSSGIGSPQHLGAALMESLAGIKMSHVPYKGAAPALQDLVPGRIHVWVGAANTILPQVRGGKLRLLAGAGPRRYASLPDLPTIAESGLPGYSLDVWLGLAMPARVPEAVVAKVNADVARVLQSPELRADLAAQGIEVATNSPREFAQIIRDDYERWGKVVREAGIKAD
jgi:tripartite-type tricarboxylate transporter receptor subunit TctC